MSEPFDLERLVFTYAQRRYFDRLERAVVRGIISDNQAQALMDMWYEEHAPEDMDQ